MQIRQLAFATCATGSLSYLTVCGARSSSQPDLVARDAAQIFSEGVISDTNEQWRITFAPDGKTAYFAESAEFFPFTRKATIYVSEYVDGQWSTPVVAPFSGTYSDIDPFISPNGQRLYFSSIRPVDGVLRGDIDIWMVERTRAGWSAPIHLGREVNSPADELPNLDPRARNARRKKCTVPTKRQHPQPLRTMDIQSGRIETVYSADRHFEAAQADA